ncbi:MAG: acetate kinase [Bacilli bacterium]|nr:acetate kinase [Bacilli bacterium]MDD3895520.1 acetate kinase [Bacilli bacterium]MDD4407574.1 acetate kinase [Bacilli bacterium]
MKILSVNAGSSSLKFTLFEMPEEKELISGVFERIGLKNSFYTIKLKGEKFKTEVDLKNHKDAFEILIKELINNKIIKNLNEVEGIGHRTVQGGPYFNKTVIATKDNIKIVEDLSCLAPLHNPPIIVAIKAAMEVFMNATQTLVFDTAFHQTIEKENYIYPVPYEWYTKYNIRRYGFHGTSHKYITLRASEIMKRNDLKLITCHIGNGASISAVKNGQCINTSMGFTPNAGLMMGTRSGDIDATIITYIMKQTGISAEMIDDILNKESGLLGVSGVSSDSRDVEAGIEKGDERCLLAQNIYVNRVVEYIAKYYVELEGADAIIFTAGLGENGIAVRKQIIDKLAVLGIKIDENRNNIRGEEKLISADDSKVPVYVIPTNEELMIALDTYTLIK